MPFPVLKTLSAALLSLPLLADAAALQLADRHSANNIPCTACHAAGLPKAATAYSNCLNCHGGSYEKLAERTDNGDINFHATHLGEPGCGECHRGHKPSVLVCEQCHEFKVAVP